MNVLFCGCSFTASSGFNDENLQDLWVNIVSKELNFNSTNIAFGGMSNHEIFKRTTNKIIETNPNLVVVMWSELHRLWCYTNHLFGNRKLNRWYSLFRVFIPFFAHSDMARKSSGLIEIPGDFF